jgi:hypothetical protein
LRRFLEVILRATGSYSNPPRSRGTLNVAELRGILSGPFAYLVGRP